MKIVTAIDIRVALLQQGFSCRSWARANGFNPRTVQKCIRNHAPKKQHKVRGAVYLEILHKLSHTLGVDLVGDEHE
ncbi:hypothetical protein [Photobacterium nomapromontoriensis]|uniref:hypothetical protein n=1 Tax=Photobacterium nomapromontoriensis TaxID=2910237 RepID=UPI003D0A319E